MVRISSDRATLAVLFAVCGGTLVALAMTSAAKKANMIGPPRAPKKPSLDDFDERIKRLEKK